MTDIAISVQNVGKMYRIFDKPEDRLKDGILWRWGKRYGREFWALRDVSFEVKKGESVGIIGRNGSGKSTLLQIIAGTLQPTTGSVQVNGRVAALLELGSGFNPDYTGRENVYMNAAILGLTQAETDAKFDEIAAFADIGQFLDQPVKTYSSGMMVRLAFAVQTAVDPDILIVDEALAVGDIFFQQKCFARIHKVLEAGTTLLFVSHDLKAVSNLCRRGTLLKDGNVVFDGPSSEAASRYYAAVHAANKDVHDKSATRSPTALPDHRTMRDDILAHNIATNAQSRHGTRAITLEGARFINELGIDSMQVEVLKTATIQLVIRAHRDIQNPCVGLHLHDRMGQVIFAAGTRALHVDVPPMKAGEELCFSLELTMSVTAGEYTFGLDSFEPATTVNQGIVHDRIEGLGPISVWYDNQAQVPFHGIAQLPFAIQLLKADEVTA